MNKKIFAWIGGVVFIAGILVATYYVVDINQKAKSGLGDEKSSTFYGH